MKQNNTKKGVLALCMITFMAASLLGGITIGRLSANGTPAFSTVKYYLSELTEKGDKTTQNSRIVDPLVEIKPVPENDDEGYSTPDIYKKVIPSVVCINAYTSNSVSYSSSGTGIVMTKDGYIITNAHVVSGASYVNVILNDGTEYRGEIIGSDTDTDLAVIKVGATDLTAAEFGDSTQLEIGERSVVIGNAGGLSGSCTQGIISGLDRRVDSSRRSLSLIQTNAAINPGNSGGPLVNRFGQIIGITSSKIASVNYEGIGFAIPITEALPIIQSLISNGYVTGRRVLGVQIIILNPANGPTNGLPTYGAYIAGFDRDSNLQFQGVRERDVIMKANGVVVVSSDILLEQLNKFSPGDDFDLEIYRPETGETFDVTVKLIEAKQN